MVSSLLINAGLHPTTAIGGIINGQAAYNANLGEGKYFVAEVDESDGTFLYFNPHYSIITNMDFEHVDFYKNWEGINGIVHTHSTFGTAWAQSQRCIPIFGTTHADHLTVDIPCAPPMDDEMIKGDYEYETGFQIINHFKELGLDHKEVEMVLVGNHAPFTWGKTAEKAVYNSAVLETVAHMAYLTEQINHNAPRLKDALIKKHFERKHGPDSYYGQ